MVHRVARLTVPGQCQAGGVSDERRGSEADREASGPDWVRDALRQFSDEVRLFVRTAVDFTLQARASALES